MDISKPPNKQSRCHVPHLNFIYISKGRSLFVTFLFVSFVWAHANANLVDNIGRQ
jgi:hypothetical protein